MATIVTYAFDKRRWNEKETNLDSDANLENLLDMYGTNNSLELNATQIVNEFFHDEDEDYIDWEKLESRGANVGVRCHKFLKRFSISIQSS